MKMNGKALRDLMMLAMVVVLAAGCGGGGGAAERLLSAVLKKNIRSRLRVEIAAPTC